MHNVMHKLQTPAGCGNGVELVRPHQGVHCRQWRSAKVMPHVGTAACTGWTSACSGLYTQTSNLGHWKFVVYMFLS